MMEACPRKTGNRIEPGGFVLLEVLPALTVLLLALMGSMRLVWTAVEHNRALDAERWREQVLPVLWHQWEADDGDAAVVDEADDGPQIRFFPSADWLPGDSGARPSQLRMILRRERVELAGWPAWRVSRRIPSNGGEVRWQDLVVILHREDPEEAQ